VNNDNSWFWRYCLVSKLLTLTFAHNMVYNTLILRCVWLTMYVKQVVFTSCKILIYCMLIYWSNIFVSPLVLLRINLTAAVLFSLVSIVGKQRDSWLDIKCILQAYILVVHDALFLNKLSSCTTWALSVKSTPFLEE